MSIRYWRRGQVSMILMVFIAVVLLLAMSTFNIGMVAQTKTSTAIAADAAALAAASWVASAENEVALGPARGMWIIYIAFQIMLGILPFKKPMQGVLDAAKVWLAYVLIQHFKAETAKELLKSGWQEAHAQAYFIAFNNVGVDDPRPATEADSYSAFIHGLEKEFRDLQKAVSNNWPLEKEFTWDRQPDDSTRGEQTVKVQVEFLNPQPEFETSMWGPIGRMWWQCIYTCCYTGPAWAFGTEDKQAKWYTKLILQMIPRPSTSAGVCFVFPFPFMNPIWQEQKPKSIADVNGEIRVTVTRTSQDADLRLWNMDYPDEVVSMAQAKYGPGDDVNMVSLWPRDRSEPRLEKVQ